MLRLIVLVATLAVAQSTTLLYPSSYRQVAWPIQNQYPLSTVSLSPSLSYPVSNYYPYTTVYRYPLQVQYQPIQYKYVQSTPLYTHTRTLPLLWNRRSFGEQSPAVPTQYAAVPPTSYAQQVSHPVAAPVSYGQQQVNHQVAAPVASQQSFVAQPAYVSQSAAPVSNYVQPAAIQSGQYVSHVSASVPTQQAVYANSPRSSGEPIAFENTYQVSPATYSPYGQAVSQPAVVHSFIAPNGAIAEPVSIPAHQNHQSGQFVGSNQIHHAQSVPIAYVPSVQPSTAQISHVPHVQQSTYVQPGQHQESVGHHQVSHVSIPGQVGVGGGYSSAAFYETAPASVVIPSVPVQQEQPIVAADVKHISAKGSEQVAHQNLRVQTTY